MPPVSPLSSRYLPYLYLLTTVIAGQCRTNLWPVVPDWPWCRNAGAELRQLTNRRYADDGLIFFRIPVFRHLHMILQHDIGRITPAAACGRTECINFHYLQFGVLDVSICWVLDTALDPKVVKLCRKGQKRLQFAFQSNLCVSWANLQYCLKKFGTKSSILCKTPRTK